MLLYEVGSLWSRMPALDSNGCCGAAAAPEAACTTGSWSEACTRIQACACADIAYPPEALGTLSLDLLDCASSGVWVISPAVVGVPSSVSSLGLSTSKGDGWLPNGLENDVSNGRISSAILPERTARELWPQSSGVAVACWLWCCCDGAHGDTLSRPLVCSVSFKLLKSSSTSCCVVVMCGEQSWAAGVSLWCAGGTLVLCWLNGWSVSAWREVGSRWGSLELPCLPSTRSLFSTYAAQ